MALWTDLEIEEKIIPIIDKTITSYGHQELIQLLRTVQHVPDVLNARQNVLRQMLVQHTIVRKIRTCLLKIKKLEPALDWLHRPEEDIDELKGMYFGTEIFNSKELLTLKNSLRIYSPSLMLAIYLVAYCVLRYYGIQVSLKMYFHRIYESYVRMAKMLILMVSRNIGWASFLGTFLGTTYAVYQVYMMYHTAESSITHYKDRKLFKESMYKIKTFLNIVHEITTLDTFLPGTQQRMKGSLDILNKKFDQRIRNTGYLLLLKREPLEQLFESVLEYIGRIDMFISISALVFTNGFQFPEYDFDAKSPYISITNCWYAGETQYAVVNDCHLTQNMILTGPNTSGKSTYIRAVALSVFLAQTIGLSPCQHIKFTPYTHIFTYIDIPNIARTKESLFEAEIMRSIKLCNMIETLDQSEFVFAVMDELFTGTNPKEGTAGSYGVCQYLGQFTNVNMIVTTHFHELTRLPEQFVNYKFTVNKTADGYQRDYRIKPGVSDQNIAIELLRTKGYNSEIIDLALNKLRDLEKNGFTEYQSSAVQELD